MKYRIYAFLVTSILCSAIYSNALRVPFHYDDDFAIVRDQDVHVDRLGLNEIGVILSKGRPAATLSFAVNYRLGELDVFGYHLVNIIVHILAAFGLFLFAELTLSIARNQTLKASSIHAEEEGLFKRKETVIALLAALLWAANPVNTQAVTYIVQRMTGMAAMFYVYSLVFYAWGRLASGKRRIVYFSLTILAALLAIGSKQIAITLPAAIFLFEVCVIRGGNIDFIKEKRFYLPALTIISLVISIAVLWDYTREYLYLYYPDKGLLFVVKERFFTQSRVFIDYLSLFLFPLPSRLSIEHDISLSRNILDPPGTVIAVLLVLFMAAYSLASIKRRPLAAFLLLWVLLTSLPEAAHVSIAVMYEHRMYLPFMALAIMISYGIVETAYAVNGRIVIVAAVLTVVLYSLGTYTRNLVWKDDVSLWSDAVSKSPYSAAAHTGLGVALLKAGRVEESIEVFENGKRVNPREPFILYYLGVALYKAKLYDRAVREFRVLWRMGFDNPDGQRSIDAYYYDMAVYFLGSGDMEKAFSLLREAQSFHPENERIEVLIRQIWGRIQIHGSMGIQR